MSGGSGMPYVPPLLTALRRLDVETHLIVTSGAARVLAGEAAAGGAALRVADLEALARVTHSDRDLGASIASGSYPTDGMLVLPCSAGTLAKVAAGFTDTLLTRAAHVTLKERRRLVLALREDPFSRPMLSNMLAAHDAGATVMSASPGFYHAPGSVDELLNFVVVRLLDQFGLDAGGLRRWEGT